jgi:anti-sigma regulatory factor (Ser/Thr protein kinase)/type II secretory pathway pseudopilin PulG
VSLPGISLALAMVACCYVVAVRFAPAPLYGVQPLFGISLNAGIVAALSVLPRRRQAPAFLLAVAAFSVGVWRPGDLATVRLAVPFAIANVLAVSGFRVMAARYAGGGRRPDTRRSLLALLGCAVTAVAANAAVAAGLGALAVAAGWVPANPALSAGFLFGIRPAAQLDGIVTITPLVWMLMSRDPRSWPWRTWAETGWWLAVLVAASGTAAVVGGVALVFPLLLLITFAGLVFAVLRLGSLAAAVLSPAFGVLAAAVLLASTPPDRSLPGAVLFQVLLSQLAGLIAAVLAWAVSSVVTERDEARQLAAAEAAAREALTSVQTALLPTVVTSGNGVEVSARYRAAGAFNRIGGDWYDTIDLPGGGIALVIGDVEGHDLIAASVMGLVRGAVRSYALEGQPPSGVLQRVSAFVVSAGIDRLVTMAYAQLYPGDTLVTIALGGHPAPIVVHPDGIARLMDVRAGPILGVEGLAGWPEETVRLARGSSLVLYTDGLMDFPAASGDQQERLVALAAGVSHQPVDVLADTLISTAPPYDDAAVLAARLTCRSAPFVQRTFPAQPISASTARTWLADLFGSWQSSGLLPASGQADVSSEAELLLTELMTNALRHGDGAVRVRLLLRDQRLRVEVADTSDRMPVMRPPATSGVPGEGRGLHLVDALAAAWGSRLEERGKVVWFELGLECPSQRPDRVGGPGPLLSSEVRDDVTTTAGAGLAPRALGVRCGCGGGADIPRTRGSPP